MKKGGPLSVTAIKYAYIVRINDCDVDVARL